ncbi:hypothetical protein F5B22DRAFT_586325 [Xylaria bambusicola]|uniref:uncharacterized protein n=1 Tax=Xylaria bambusicola TaxID=326684 RepID=UPI0020081207|nr:uncharacterized protein F5B22DRAFT_586325 [Xylaria bambusicola]KAI0526530.1 hypothetical protein F5B22DRAFT_586325 [Xylaria bambusicola]
MARLTQGPITPHRSVSNPDSLTDLTRLLSRLQQSILHADAERERSLRTSEHERNKAGINLEYARTLLTKLEQDALAIKVHSRRVEMQADLNQKRDIFEQLVERLRELDDISIDSDEDDSDEGEDLLGDIIPTPSQSSDSRSADHIRDELGDVQQQESEDCEGESTILPEPKQAAPQPMPTKQASPLIVPVTAASPTLPPEPHATTTITSPTLRPRGSAIAAQKAPVTDTATTTSALRSQLLGAAAASSTTTATTTATAEAILDHHRAEQDKLTESMVSMAKALKASTHAFSTALREDQDVLEGASKGLDRNERNLDGVAGRMGSLRRLTEGKGWWGRMILYAWIAGLAVFAVLLVFVFPKLRF